MDDHSRTSTTVRYVCLAAALAALQFGKAASGQARPAPPPPPPPATVASLGTCRLGSGATIENCRVAYRTFGRLNAARTKAVLIPTWLPGRSSSPSNTPEGRAAFRALTIADMVEAQHRLVVEILKLPGLHAVLGISMGGMQAFEWAVRYPTFVDAVVPIVGTPQTGA